MKKMQKKLFKTLKIYKIIKNLPLKNDRYYDKLNIEKENVI